MSLREIVQWPDTRLSTVCAPVGGVTTEVETLVQDMLETMYAAPGRGLAAPQVGELKRLFVMDVTWKDGERNPVICIDPEVVCCSDTMSTQSEGCLSIPGISVDIVRPDQILLQWTDLSGAQQEKRLDGFAAICAQHEMDHLDGKVTLDRLDAETRARVLKDYGEVTA